VFTKHTQETTMANEISMLDKQAIAGLHGQGLSNRQIARLLDLDRGTVGRQVSLLNAQNPPQAPSGSLSKKGEESGNGVMAQTAPGDAGSVTATAGETPGSSGCCGADEKGAGVAGKKAAGRLPEAATSARAATTEAPSGKVADLEPIGKEEQQGSQELPAAPTHGPDRATEIQNPPGAPSGRMPQKDALGEVARLSFSAWNEVPAKCRRQVAEVQNPPGAPTGKIPEQPASSTGESEGTSEVPVTTAAPTVLGSLLKTGTTSLCAPFHEFIEKQCELGVEAQRIWQDLVADHGFTGKYWSVRRYVAKLTARRALPFRRLETAPGVEGQVDFGTGAWVVSPDGKRRRPWVFRLILSHSRKGYSEVVWRQTTEMFIECLENAFRHLGGVPERIVLDNLKAAVSQADWYDPEIHPKLQSFAAHYGTVFLPTKPYTPRHKGKVEGGVKYVKNNGLAGRSFESLEAQNEHLWRWEAQVADQRIHGTTKRQVRALFDEQERAALQALPGQRFPLFREESRIVHRDGHVEVGQAYYAAPPEYVGRTVWVRWDSRLLRLYDDRWTALFTYAVTTPGKFQTHPDAIPAKKKSAVERGAQSLLKEVSRIGPKTRDWAAATVQARGVEATRVLVGLRSLTHRHEAHTIERACELALAGGSYRLRTIRELLKRKVSEKQEQFEFTQEHPVIRQLEDYSLEKLLKSRGDRRDNPLSFGEEHECETDRNSETIATLGTVAVIGCPVTRSDV
jgi:transposase